MLENEAVINVTVLQRVGNTFRPRRKKNLLNADRIKGLTASLDSGIDTAEGEFLLAASHQLDNIHNAIYNVTESDKEDDGDVDDLVPAWLPVDEEPLVTVVGCVPPPAAAAAPQAAPAPLAGRGRPQRGCAATGPEAAPAAPPAGRGRLDEDMLQLDLKLHQPLLLPVKGVHDETVQLHLLLVEI